MGSVILDSDEPVLVEFSLRAGEQEVHGVVEDLTMKSKLALSGAMSAIRGMASDLMDTINRMSKKPSEVEVGFGIKFDAEAGALIAKAGTEASMNVLLKWQKEMFGTAEEER
jgi:hypothetical protein